MRISDWSSDVCSSDLVGRERQADIALKQIILAITLIILPVASDEGRSFAVVAQTKIEHTGDRIGPVIRRRAVAKHFQLADSDGRNGCKVRALRTPNIGDVGQLYRRTAMPTLAIHQHNRLIRWQAAHAVPPQSDELRVGKEVFSKCKLW